MPHGYNGRILHVNLTTGDLSIEEPEEAFYHKDSINLCQFVFGPGWQLYGPDHLVQATQAVTGWDVTLTELMQVGERRLNMLRAFNARDGIGREADTLPKKFFDRPLQGGRSNGYVVDQARWQEAVETYYTMSGWDVQTGYPTREKLEALDLGWVADVAGL